MIVPPLPRMRTVEEINAEVDAQMDAIAARFWHLPEAERRKAIVAASYEACGRMVAEIQCTADTPDDLAKRKADAWRWTETYFPADADRARAEGYAAPAHPPAAPTADWDRECVKCGFRWNESRSGPDCWACKALPGFDPVPPPAPAPEGKP